MIDGNGLPEFICEPEEACLFCTADFDEGWREALYRVKAWVESHAVEYGGGEEVSLGWENVKKGTKCGCYCKKEDE